VVSLVVFPVLGLAEFVRGRGARADLDAALRNSWAQQRILEYGQVARDGFWPAYNYCPSTPTGVFFFRHRHLQERRDSPLSSQPAPYICSVEAANSSTQAAQLLLSTAPHAATDAEMESVQVERAVALAPRRRTPPTLDLSSLPPLIQPSPPSNTLLITVSCSPFLCNPLCPADNHRRTSSIRKFSTLPTSSQSATLSMNLPQSTRGRHSSPCGASLSPSTPPTTPFASASCSMVSTL